MQGLPERVISAPGLSLMLLLPFWLIIFDTAKKFGRSAFFPSERCISQRFLFSLTVMFVAVIFLACLRAFFGAEIYAKARIIYTLLLWITVPLFFVALRIRGFSLELGNKIFLASAGLFLLANLLLYFLGFISQFQGVGSEHAFLSGMFGFDTVRMALPLSYDTGSGGALAGLSFLGAITGIIYLNKMVQKIACFGLLLLSLWAIFLTDSRGALFFGMVAILVVIFIPSLTLRSIKWLVFLLPILPVLVVAASDYMPALLTSDVTEISRDGSSLVTSRDFIWHAVLNKLATFDPIQVFGYGLFGQLPSGVSLEYIELFIERADFSEAALMPTHNNILQLVMDVGYFGMLVYLLIFYNLFNVHIDKAISSGGKSFTNVMLLAGMLYLTLIGLTSVTLYYANSTLIFSWFMMNLVFTVVDVPGRLRVQGGDKVVLSARKLNASKI